MKVESKNKDGAAVVCYVRKPNAKDNHDAKLYGNAVASTILLRKNDEGKPNFITRQQVKQILKDSNRLSEKEEQNIMFLSDRIRELEDKLIKGGIRKSEGRDIAIELREKRNLLFISLMNINELDEHTLESEVENANFDFLVARCTAFEDGKSVFNSVDDYRDKAEDEPYAYEAANTLKVLLYGTTEDILKNNIENKFLAKYKFIDEKLRLINEHGKFVDKAGNLVDEEGNQLNEEATAYAVILGEFLDDEVKVEEVEPVEEVVAKKKTKKT